MKQPNLDRSTRPTNALVPILALFTVTFFIYRDFGLRMMLGYGILCLLLGIHVLRALIENHPPVVDAPRMAFVILSVAVFLNFLRPDSRHDADSVSYVIAMIICCAFVILCSSGQREGKIAMGLCFSGGIFIAAFVLFFQFFPQLFWDGLYHSLSETAQLYLVKYVPKGYAITLGGCTYTNYILYLGISVGCAYITSRKFDWRSAVVAALSAAFLVALLLVGRRGELLGALICLVLLVLCLCNKRWRRILLIGGTIGAVAAFALIVALLPWLKQFQPLVRYVMTFEKLLSGQDITSGRVELYALALDAFVKNPIFGIGFDQFHTLIPQEFLNIHGQEVEDVHCIYLQFLTETGIVGAPFLTAPLLYGYYLVCSQFRRLKHCGPELRTARMLCITSFMIQSFLLILGIYDPNFQRVVFWCFYAISIVLMLNALQIEGYQPTDPVSRLLNRLISLCAPPFVLVWNWAAKLFSRLRKAKWSSFTFPQVLSGIDRYSKFTDQLLLILAVFTGTFFIYRDFGIRMIFGFGALCLMLLLHLLRRLLHDRSPKLRSFHLPYIALSLVILLNFLRPASRHDEDSVSYIISMLISVCFVLLATPGGRESRRSLTALYWAGFFMAAFVVFFVLFEDLFWVTLYHLLTPTAQAYLDFFVPSGYAITLGGCTYTNYILYIGLAVCCGRICSSPKWTKKCSHMLLCCLFCLLALVLVGRRGELLGALVCCVLLVLAMCEPRRRRQLIVGGVIALAAAFGLIVLFLPVLKQVSVLQRYVVTIENLLAGQDVTTGRVALYRLALNAFREHPFFGIGWDQFYTLVPAEFLTDPVVDIEDVHCIYLQFLCETGALGAPLIIAPLVYYYYLVCSQFRRLKRRAAESKKLTLAFDLCVTSFMLQSFLLFVGIYDPNFQRIVFWCFYSLSILMLTAALQMERYRPADPVSRFLHRCARQCVGPCKTLWSRLAAVVQPARDA